MPKGVYAAASAMLVESYGLESAARNLAHLTTPGYRREIATHQGFADMLRSQGAAIPPRDGIARDGGAGIHAERAIREFSDGVRDPTGNTFDLALTGKGFFVVQAADGREMLTRAGHFLPDSQGRLLTPEGFMLMGQGGPLTIPESGQVQISRDGTLSVQSSTGGISTHTVLDQVRIAEVDDPRMLHDLNGQYFMADGQALRDPTNTQVHQGMLERSNVEGVQTLVEMIALQRRHDAAQKALTEQTNLGGSLGEIMRS